MKLKDYLRLTLLTKAPASRFLDRAKYIMLVRAATEADLAGMVEIENREILENFAHFGQTPVTLAQARASLDNARGKYPWFVAEDEGEIVGFARCGPWKARESYRFTTEVGVYVRPERQ